MRPAPWNPLRVPRRLATVRRWVVKLLPLFGNAFRRRQRPVGNSWRVEETYILVKGQWKYLYRAVDKAGKTIDFLLRARRNTAAALRFFEKAIAQIPPAVLTSLARQNLLGRQLLHHGDHFFVI